MASTRSGVLAQLTPETTMILINEVKNRTFLWDQDHEDYNNRFRSGSAWLEISRKINLPDHATKLKWKYLRDTYLRALKKQSYNGRWQYFKELSFLSKVVRTENDAASEYLESHDSDMETHDSVEGKDSNTSESDTSSSDDSDSGGSKSLDNSSSVIENNRDRLDINVNNIKPDTPTAPVILRTSEEYDLMFLESLLPYFREIEPKRKLVLRSKIQDMLLGEIGLQMCEIGMQIKNEPVTTDE